VRVYPSIAAAALVFTCTAPSLATTVAQQAYEVPSLRPSLSAPVVFADAMKQSSPWTSAQPLTLDEHGDVASLAPGQIAQRVVFAPGQLHPAGDYTLLYDGAGTFGIDGADVVEQAPGRDIVRVVSPSSGLILRLLSTSAGTPARNVRLVLPGYAASYATAPFYRPFVRALAGADALRFDAWSNADALVTPQTWALRPRVSDATQASETGTAPEYEIALANATGTDPWFVLPVGATDAYAYGVADLVHRFLDPRLHPMFEYGDRVWMPATPENAYAAMAARNVGIPDGAQSAPLEWYAARSIQIFAIVRSAFGPDAGRASFVLGVPGADSAYGRYADSLIASFDRAARASTMVAIDAATNAGAAATLARVGLAGGPAHASWRAVAGGWLGQGTISHARVAPPGAYRFAVGADAAPERERGGPPEVALHPMPLVQPRAPAFVEASGASFAAEIGQPLDRVDLTREGVDDWSLSLSPAHAETKAAGGRQIEIEIANGRALPFADGYSSFSWADGARQTAGFSSAGVLIAGARAEIRVSAPADAREHILRIYVGAVSSRVSMSARVGDATYAGDARYAGSALVSTGTVRDAVYTLVYRAQTPARVEADFIAASTSGGGGIVIRGVTLREASETSAEPATDETTYHNDELRTGWDPDETVLNAANVASAKFGLIRTLHVDGNVLAQPLYVSHFRIPGHGTHNMLIVATEHDSIYEFDADSGAYLRKASLGPSQSSADVGCGDIQPEYGITSTPVIDRGSNTIYVVAATEPSSFVFHTKIHALDLTTLTDKVRPQEIEASVVTSDGTKISYDPQNQQNRASLVWSEDSLYLGIGSHCDNDPGAITGWVLRYDRSLRQIGRFATTEDSTGYFLSSVWMAGFAPAVDSAGNVFVVTGNGAFDVNRGGHNFGESVLKITPTLTRVLSIFTPDNWRQLNVGDVDFGSGGIMLLPPQQDTIKYTAVAQGKWSTIYLLNRSSLGGLEPGDKGALQSIVGTGGGVWGGPAYFSGPTGQFVYYQSGGSPLTAYSVAPGQNGAPSLTLSSSGPSYAGYGGSTPVVSSDGQLPGTGIVWLVNRNRPLQLEAYDAADVSHLLFQGNAGVWENPANNGFVTPLVAGGHVFVPATGTISVFGLGAASNARSSTNASAPGGFAHQVHGWVVSVDDGSLLLRLRDGSVIRIDIAAARSARHVGVLPVGHAVVVYGYIDRNGEFHASSVGHASPDPKDWSADR
jgi:hypothetical protein